MPSRNTPIGFLHRLLCIHIPKLFFRVDLLLTNGRITSGGSRLGNYLMHEKHPAVIVCSIGLLKPCRTTNLPDLLSRPYHRERFSLCTGCMVKPPHKTTPTYTAPDTSTLSFYLSLRPSQHPNPHYKFKPCGTNAILHIRPHIILPRPPLPDLPLLEACKEQTL